MNKRLNNILFNLLYLTLLASIKNVTYHVPPNRIYVVGGIYVEIITEGVELLYDLICSNYFDEKKYKRYINTMETKIFIKHENEVGRNTNKQILERELRKVLEDETYEDLYGFYIIKKNIDEFKNDIEYIKENNDEILNNVLTRVYKFLPSWMKVNPKIILYAGGEDGGFATFTKNVYVNLGKYIGRKEEFEKVLAHEFYHTRHISFQKKITLFIKTSLYPEKAMFDTLGRVLEEGIACLVQQGINFDIDDPVGTLTKRDILLSKEHFDMLNSALLSIKEERPNYNIIYKISVYVLGYIIARTLYENDGIFILDEWTVNFDYKKPIKRYVKLCREKNKPSGFARGIENWLLDK